MLRRLLTSLSYTCVKHDMFHARDEITAFLCLACLRHHASSRRILKLFHWPSNNMITCAKPSREGEGKGEGGVTSLYHGLALYCTYL